MYLVLPRSYLIFVDDGFTGFEIVLPLSFCWIDSKYL